MRAHRQEIITIALSLFLFAGVLAFWFHSPFYLEKKAMEREAAIQFLIRNSPDSIELMSLSPYDRQVLQDYRQGIMKRYNLTEADLKLNSGEPTPKQELLDKNPAVKFLLGYK